MKHLLAIVLLVTCTSATLEPQVAFHCGKPSVYMSLEGRSKAGWVRDSEQGCVDKLEDVLAFCKRVYPTLAKTFITVVPSSNVIQIHNWCDLNQERCDSRNHNHQLVRPFKCLTTAFVPEALLVPDKCSFGHIFSPSVGTSCKHLDNWKEAAIGKCQALANRTQLFSMGVLTPCQEDKNDVVVQQRYAGVEYVCCPKDVEMSVAPQAYVVNGAPVSHHIADDIPRTNDDFLAARVRLQNEEMAKEKKLEMTYEEAMKRLSNMQDLKAAQRLIKQLKKRFMMKFEETLSNEVARWRALEVQRTDQLSSETSEDLKRLRGAFMTILLSENPQVKTLWPSLSEYFSLVMRAKLRALSHFTQLIVSDPFEAARDRQVLNDEFIRLNNKLEELLSELNRVPHLKDELRSKTHELSDKYGNLEMSKNILLGSSINTEGEGGKPKLQRDGENRMREIISRYAGKVFMTRRKEIIFANQDRESVVDEHKVAGGLPIKHMAFHNTAVQTETQTGTTGSSPSYQVGSLIGGLVAGMALLLLVLVVVLTVRHRQEKPHGGYIMSVVELSADDEQAICPATPNNRAGDEKHLANMQINGYENPTYKFFEKS